MVTKPSDLTPSVKSYYIIGMSYATSPPQRSKTKPNTSANIAMLHMAMPRLSSLSLIMYNFIMRYLNKLKGGGRIPQ